MSETFLSFPDPTRVLGQYLSRYAPDAVIKDGTPSTWKWGTEARTLVRLTVVGGNSRKWGEYQDAVLVVDVANKSREEASRVARLLHAVTLDAHLVDPAIESVIPLSVPQFDPEEQANTPAYVFRIRMTYKGKEITL